MGGAAREQGAAAVYLDDGVHSAVEAMEEIGERLGRQGLEVRRFKVGLAAQPPAVSLSGAVAAQVGLTGLGMVPVVGALTGAVDPQQVAQGADRLRAALGARLRSPTTHDSS